MKRQTVLTRTSPRLTAVRWAKIRQAVRDRDGGMCVACGIPLGADWECHHRRYRSRGGTHVLSNLIACCGRCHQRIHEGSADVAQANGWAVSQFGDHPSLIPVRYFDGSVRSLAPEQAA